VSILSRILPYYRMMIREMGKGRKYTYTRNFFLTTIFLRHDTSVSGRIHSFKEGKKVRHRFGSK